MCEQCEWVEIGRNDSELSDKTFLHDTKWHHDKSKWNIKSFSKLSSNRGLSMEDYATITDPRMTGKMKHKLMMRFKELFYP